MTPKGVKMRNPLLEQICRNLLNIQGFSLRNCDDACRTKNGSTIMMIESTKPKVCPICNKSVSIYDHKNIVIQHGVLNGRPVFLEINLRRFDCPDCGIKTEQHEIFKANEHYSEELNDYVSFLSEKMSNKQVSEITSIPPSTVYNIDKRELEKRELRTKTIIPKVKRASIDEIGYKRGHTYATVLLNSDDCKIIDISKGKSKVSATELFNKYSYELSSLESISMDFSPSYINAALERWNSNCIVFDKFHFSRLVNKAVEGVRREIQKMFNDDDRIKCKKQVRWLMLRREKNFEVSHYKRLEQLKALNNDLYEVYILKEDLLSLFDGNHNRIDAKLYLIDWIKQARNTSYRQFHTLAKSIEKRLDLITNWFERRVTNAKAEATNNHIRTLIKRAYGYKNFDYFRLKVLQACGYLNLSATHST